LKHAAKRRVARGERHGLRQAAPHACSRETLDTQFGSRSATLATPACAQTSSLSPPGAPPTPRAPTMAFFDLNATAPGSAMTLRTVASRGAYGLVFTRSKNLPDVSKSNIGPSLCEFRLHPLSRLVFLSERGAGTDQCHADCQCAQCQPAFHDAFFCEQSLP